jgi:hypothetical protein
MTTHPSVLEIAPRRNRPLFRLLKRLFGGTVVLRSVQTKVRLNMEVEQIWRNIMFYEDVPGRPPWPLRIMLPRPLRSRGDKMALGASIRCEYERGDLIKKITAVAPPHRLEFNVLVQSLGIEDCFITSDGSYEIRERPDGAEVALTTNYRSCVHPRFLWDRLERLAVHELHRYILRGIQSALAATTSPLIADEQTSVRPYANSAGGAACTGLQSRSRQ